MQEFLAEVISIKFLTLDIAELSVNLIAPEELEFVAGQCMEIKFEGKSYALPITVPPQENNKVLNFCFGAGKNSPLQEYVKDLTSGKQITLFGPTGEFGKEVQTNQLDVLCMAEKTGIAPFASMIPDMLVKNSDRKIKLLFQVRSEDEMFYFARFSRLANTHPNFTFTPMVVRPFSHWPGEIGTAPTFVDVSGKNFKDYAVYISGHKSFVDAVAGEWHKIQLDKKDIYRNIVPEGL